MNQFLCHLVLWSEIVQNSVHICEIDSLCSLKYLNFDMFTKWHWNHNEIYLWIDWNVHFKELKSVTLWSEIWNLSWNNWNHFVKNKKMILPLFYDVTVFCKNMLVKFVFERIEISSLMIWDNQFHSLWIWNWNWKNCNQFF